MNNALGNVQSVLVLGGGSDLALAIVRAIAGRDPARFGSTILFGHSVVFGPTEG